MNVYFSNPFLFLIHFRNIPGNFYEKLLYIYLYTKLYFQRQSAKIFSTKPRTASLYKHEQHNAPLDTMQRETRGNNSFIANARARERTSDAHIWRTNRNLYSSARTLNHADAAAPHIHVLNPRIYIQAAENLIGEVSIARWWYTAARAYKYRNEKSARTAEVKRGRWGRIQMARAKWGNSCREKFGWESAVGSVKWIARISTTRSTHVWHKTFFSP